MCVINDSHYLRPRVRSRRPAGPARHVDNVNIQARSAPYLTDDGHVELKASVYAGSRASALSKVEGHRSKLALARAAAQAGRALTRLVSRAASDFVLGSRSPRRPPISIPIILISRFEKFSKKFGVIS